MQPPSADSSPPVIPLLEREQTNESLRVEREKVDDALAEQITALEETADAVINKARERADEVLARARARTDRHTDASNEHSTATIEKSRQQEDAIVRKERAAADEAVSAERAEHNELLSAEREETDKDLDIERARSDAAVATRDEFLGIVSHDLRNMLSSMVMHASLISESKETLPDKARTHAQRIQRAGARMNRLIGDLVDVASIEAGVLAVTREVSDPIQIVQEAIDSFQAQASASGISLVAEFVEPLSPVDLDPARVLQVLSNLLSNALKFTIHGKVLVRVERAADELLFTVRDTGAGIRADQLQQIFLRFHQVTSKDRRGVGLGLYISKCIVEGHGGRIWAESKVGHGSTFCFTLPVA